MPLGDKAKAAWPLRAATLKQQAMIRRRSGKLVWNQHWACQLSSCGCKGKLCRNRCIPQIYKGDPRPHIPSCEIASSAMGLKLGYSGFCWPHTQKHMQTKYVHDLRVLCGISCVFIFMLRPQYIRIWPNAVILIVGNPHTPNLSPCQDKNGAGSGISLVYVWCIHKIYNIENMLFCHRQFSIKHKRKICFFVTVKF